MPEDVGPDDAWTDTERWMWRQLLVGAVADFNKRDGMSPDPCNGPAWSKERSVGRAVVDILTRQPWRDALPPTGMRLVGGLFQDSIRLPYRDLPRALWLERSRIEGDLDLEGARVEGQFSLDGSCIAGHTRVSAMRAGYVAWKASRFERHVEAVLVRYDLSLHAWDAWFCDGLNLAGSHIGGDLMLDRMNATRGVNLHSTAVVGDVSVAGAHVEGGLNGTLLRARSCQLGPRSHESWVRNTCVEGGVRLDRACLSGELLLGRSDVADVAHGPAIAAQQLDVTGAMLFDGISVGASIDLNFSRLGYCNMRGARRLARVEMHGTKVTGEFLLDDTTIWSENALLDLRNARIGALQDSVRESWPTSLDLNGFELERLGGFSSDPNSNFMVRSEDWFLRFLGRTLEPLPRDHAWLDRQWNALSKPLRAVVPQRARNWAWLQWALLPSTRNAGYRPNTFRTFAAKLRDLGRQRLAYKIEYASRELDRRNSAFPRSTGLWFLRWTIGYGIGAGYFLSIVWAVVLALLCMAIGIADGGVQKPVSWWLLACVDHVLPIVSFEKDYGDMLPTHLRHFWSKLWFDFVTVVSWVIGLMLAAGFAGFTQRAK